jgi:hypothetical protein
VKDDFRESDFVLFDSLDRNAPSLLQQRAPLSNPDIQEQLAKAMTAIMHSNEAPRELYRRVDPDSLS